MGLSSSDQSSLGTSTVKSETGGNICNVPKTLPIGNGKCELSVAECGGELESLQGTENAQSPQNIPIDLWPLFPTATRNRRPTSLLPSRIPQCPRSRTLRPRCTGRQSVAVFPRLVCSTSRRPKVRHRAPHHEEPDHQVLGRTLIVARTINISANMATATQEVCRVASARVNRQNATSSKSAFLQWPFMRLHLQFFTFIVWTVRSYDGTAQKSGNCSTSEVGVRHKARVSDSGISPRVDIPRQCSAPRTAPALGSRIMHPVSEPCIRLRHLCHPFEYGRPAASKCGIHSSPGGGESTSRTPVTSVRHRPQCRFRKPSLTV
jgi:hypothetical protein